MVFHLSRTFYNILEGWIFLLLSLVLFVFSVTFENQDSSLKDYYVLLLQDMLNAHINSITNLKSAPLLDVKSRLMDTSNGISPWCIKISCLSRKDELLFLIGVPSEKLGGVFVSKRTRNRKIQRKPKLDLLLFKFLQYKYSNPSSEGF
jgi:hypothetical protein